MPTHGSRRAAAPDAGRLIDPTLQQYREIPDTEKAALPVVAPLPAPGGLGSQPYLVDRGDHQVVYLPRWQSTSGRPGAARSSPRT